MKTAPPHRPDTRQPLRSVRRWTVPVSLETSWREMPWSLRILRAFLGVTFVYAGLQKFLDPGFLHAGSPTYIGTQLQGFATGTPVAPLMQALSHAPVLVGIGVAGTQRPRRVAGRAGGGFVTPALGGFLPKLPF